MPVARDGSWAVRKSGVTVTMTLKPSAKCVPKATVMGKSRDALGRTKSDIYRVCMTLGCSEPNPQAILTCFYHHIGPAMWKPATWEADTGLARPGLVTDAGGQGSRLGFPSRKASLGIPLPRREAEPRKNIWRILFFSCAAAGPTAGHESAGTPPRRGSPRPARPTPCVP